MKLKAAVVGVGYLGTFHAQKYQTLLGSSAQPTSNPLSERVEFAGVCDLNEVQAQKVARDLGVRAWSKPEDLLGQVHLVTISSSTPSHFKLAKMFLENGIHVLVEKPLSTRTDDAKELVHLAKVNDLLLSVGHSERWNPGYLEIKKSIKSKRFIELQRLAPFRWRGAEVSVIHDLMIHDIDLLLSIDSSHVEVETVVGAKMITDTYDWVSATFRFDSGFRALIQVSRTAPEMVRQIRLIQRDSYILADLQSGKMEKVRRGETNLSEEPLILERWTVPKQDHLLLETEAFIKAVVFGGAVPCTGEDGLKALELAEKVIAQLKVVDLKES